MTGEPLFSFILFNELKRFLDKIETDNLTVSNSEIFIPISLFQKIGFS